LRDKGLVGGAGTGEPLEPGGRRRRTGCSFLIDANAYCVKFGTTYPPVDSRVFLLVSVFQSSRFILILRHCS